MLELARKRLLDVRKEIALRAGKQDAKSPRKIKDFSSLNDEELAKLKNSLIFDVR